MKFGMEFQPLNDNIIVDTRASAVLYRFLKSQPVKGTILVPVNICSIVSDIITLAEFSIEYVDIEPIHYCIDELAVLHRLKNTAKPIVGVLLNHTYGIEHDFSETIEQIKQINNAFIIDDKCLCMPGFQYHPKVDLTLYSTGYAKVVELEQRGGYGILQDSEAIHRASIKPLVTSTETIYFQDNIYYSPSYFDRIEEVKNDVWPIKQRRNEWYETELGSYSMGMRFAAWRYNILVPHKDELIRVIFENKLFASNHYKPLHQQQELYPNAWFLYNHVVNLFNDKYVSDAYLERIIPLIHNHHDTFQ